MISKRESRKTLALTLFPTFESIPEVTEEPDGEWCAVDVLEMNQETYELMLGALALDGIPFARKGFVIYARKEVD